MVAPQLQPAVAYKVNDWLSVGAGTAFTLGYLSDKLRVESIPPGGDDGKLRISDADFAVQYNLGVMLEPWEHTRIGIRYLSETDLDFEDDPNVSGVALPPLPGAKLDLGMKMPQSVHVAVHHQWDDKLALLGSVGWEEFSEFSKVQVEGNATGINTTLDADFRDVWHFGVGAEYKYKPRWELTAGFSYDTSMSTDRTRPIVIPLGNMYRYAIGVKHQKREDLILGAGLTWIYEGNLSIKDSLGVSGKYTNASITVLSFYARWL